MQKAISLIIFDVDGTLIDATELDNYCFERAFHEVTGVALTEAVWSRLNEVTAQAIVRHALGADWPNLTVTEDRVRRSFLEKLRASHASNPNSIHAFENTISLLTNLPESLNVKVAIATGCWKETAIFKLESAGFDVSNVPFASASDTYRRAEIILLAAARAGISIEQAVYVGDGVWDFNATQQLGIPFVGVGRKTEVLRQVGAKHTLDTLNADNLAHVLEMINDLRSS